ncbi:MAG: aminotransferase class IV [Bacteroidales bacterium]|nr:aminotransferase class IV [Bacteroidales bacterium]
MSLLLETIRIVDGLPMNAAYHQRRAAESSLAVFGKEIHLEFDNLLIPDEFREGVVKCRIIYDVHIHEITFEHYTPRKINSLKLVYDNQIDYSNKRLDRSDLNALVAQKGIADEILIVKNGLLSDISYGNVVVSINGVLYTPKNCLLKGTQRQQLLDEGKIVERDLTPADLQNCTSVTIINAMLGLEDNNTILPENIIF